MNIIPNSEEFSKLQKMISNNNDDYYGIFNKKNAVIDKLRRDLEIRNCLKLAEYKIAERFYKSYLPVDKIEICINDICSNSVPEDVIIPYIKKLLLDISIKKKYNIRFYNYVVNVRHYGSSTGPSIKTVECAEFTF